MSNISADLILYNANVITLDEKQPRAAMVAIESNRILKVGREEDIESFKWAKTRIVDCQGKTMVPGFNDAHCHHSGFVTSLLSVDCRFPAVRSIAGIQERIRRQAQQTPEGAWIRAVGYHEFYLVEKRHLNRWDLDEAAPHHPVKLSHRSGHACVLNSLGLQLVGISRETPEPPGGVIDRDLETGEPSGLLFEMNSHVEKAIPISSDEGMERGFKLANQQYLSHGITSIQDASWTDSLNRWQILSRFKERGMLKSRVSMMIGADEIEEFEERCLSQGSGINNCLRLGGVKMILQTTTGALNPPQEELNRLAYKAHRAGFQLTIHAVEEDEVEAAIAALEYSLGQMPKHDHRHRLEHCSICPPRLVQRLSNIQAVVVTQPPFIYYSGERYLKTVPQADQRWLYPVGSLLAGGLKVAASSDSPVVLVGIYAAAARKAETGQTVTPQECIPPLEALKMYTLNGAYASFEETVKGSITLGKLADLVVLSDDPTQVPLEEIKDIQAMMTIIDGEVVWERH
jgi:predicted amidohydrolase YtcJ